MKARKSFRDCIVKPGETSPYANLLNGLLEPQLKRPIKNVWTRNVAKNLSGSKASRTRPNLGATGISMSSRRM